MTCGSVLKPVFFLTVCILFVFSASGCGGGSAPPAGDKTPAKTAVTPSARCVEVSAAKLSEIESKLTIIGGGSLKDGRAVKSEDFDNIYFIAAEIEGPGFYENGQFGLWAAESLEPGQGKIYSVNTRAKAHSDWPDADASITQRSDGAEEAMACVDAFQKSQ